MSSTNKLKNTSNVVINPATAEGQESFSTGAVTKLTVGATATLAAMKGSALLTGLRYVILTVVSGTVYFNYGAAATASTPPLPEPFGRPITKALADTMQLYSTGGVVTLEEYV